MALIFIKKDFLTTEELEEVLRFAKNQDTTDAFVLTSMDVDGNNAKISLDFDDYGNMTVLEYTGEH